MTHDQLQQLRTMVQDAGDLPESAKAKLLELVAQAEENATAETPAGAETWSSTVEEMEASHPEATAFMNRVAISLANMGI